MHSVDVARACTAHDEQRSDCSGCGGPLVESDAVAVAVSGVAVSGVAVAVRARHDDDDGYMVRTIDDTISSNLGRSTTRYRQTIDDYCRCDACWICGAQE